MNPKTNQNQNFLNHLDQQRIDWISQRFKYIKKAVIIVLVPLCVTIVSYEGLNATTIFYVALLILLFSIYFKLDYFLSKEEASKEVGPKLKIVNRHQVDSSIGFANIQKLIQDSETVHIISPPKSALNPDINRKLYLEKVEKIIEAKLKIDSSFTYQRLIPTSNHSRLYDDESLYSHYLNINKIAKGLPNVYCRVINDLQSQLHFVMVDSKILILFFPKYIFASGVPEVADDCSFHLVITYDEESPLLRYLRQEHAALAKNEKTITNLDEDILDQLNKLNIDIPSPVKKGR